MSDGLTPLQIRKLNANFANLLRKVEGSAHLTIKSVETLPHGQQAYVNNVGTPEFPELVIGIPAGDKGDPGSSIWVSSTEPTEIIQGTWVFDISDITDDPTEIPVAGDVVFCGAYIYFIDRFSEGSVVCTNRSLLFESDNLDYNVLSNKPSIEGVTLENDKTFGALGLEALTNSEIEALLT